MGFGKTQDLEMSEMVININYFEESKKFTCPCGCGKVLILSIDLTEKFGWNAWVLDGETPLAQVGEKQ